MNIPSKIHPLTQGRFLLPPGYIKLDFIEVTEGGLNNILSFINVPTEVNSVHDSFAFETLHKVPAQDSTKWQEGVNCNYWSFHAVWHNLNQWQCHAGDTNIQTEYTNRGPIKIRLTYSPENKSVQFSYGDYKKSIYLGNYSNNVFPVNPLGVFWDANNPNPINGYQYNAYAMLGKKWWWKFYLNGKLKNYLLPALDSSGTPCMFDIVSGTTFYNLGPLPFIAGVGSVRQFAILLRELPSTGGALKLSLPADANTPEIATALQNAYNKKGWTLTIHEYRETKSSTYTLRRKRNIVWCRRIQSEYGNYTTTDGSRWRIEHCAAIFGPFGQDPTAYGYSSFNNVEQAAKQWGLTILPEQIEEKNM